MPLKIYSSSAGSGKTYTLTREYLLLMLKANKKFYFRHILAMTFTNKATEEMKTRILTVLNSLSKGKEEVLAKDLATTIGISVDELKERCTDGLRQILHNYSDFTITTIDSFFQQMLRSFTRESGLQAGYTIEMDQQKVLRFCANALIEKAGHDQELTEWLVKFTEQNLEDGKSWDIEKAIILLANQLFSEEFKAYENLLPHGKEFRKLLEEYRLKLLKYRKEVSARLNFIGTEALKIISSHGLTVDDLYYKTTGIFAYFVKLSSSQENFDANSYVIKVNNGEANWFASGTLQKAAVESAVADGLGTLLKESIQYWTDNKLNYNTAGIILQNLFTFGIFADLNELLRKYRDDENVLLISDTAPLLKNIVAGNDASFLYEKYGTQYHHFLIDEFQDTSIFQWENIRPLVMNSLASGNDNIIVGDVKQSIYRFRGGDWRLLLEKLDGDMKGFKPEHKTLDTNWRSRSNIIDLNNKLFSKAPQVLRDKFIACIEEVPQHEKKAILKLQAEFITKAYQDVHQNSPATGNKHGGYMEVCFYEEKKEEELNWKDRVDSRLPELVEQLQDKGYALSDIAFLVRTKAEASNIAFVFNNYKINNLGKPGYRYDVVSAESLVLGNSPLVNLMVNCFRYLVDPNNAIARASVISGYRIISGDSAAEKTFYSTSPQLEMLDSLNWKSFSLYSLSELITKKMSLDKYQDQRLFLQFFYDAVLQYSTDENGSLRDFIEWWDETGCLKPLVLSEDQDAMKIITLHKSKGLQFSNVIIPYACWDLETDARKNNILWCRPSSPFDDFALFPVKYTSQLKQSQFNEDYFREVLMSYMDNINLLYVALTRPVDNMFVLAPRPSESKDGKTSFKRVNDLLMESLIYDSTIEKEDLKDMVFFKSGSSIEPFTGNHKIKKDVVIKQFHGEEWSEKISLRPMSEKAFLNSENETGAKINEGLMVHDLFSHIRYHNDLDKVLESYGFKEALENDEIEFIRKSLLETMNNPLIKDYFTNEWDIKQESALVDDHGRTYRPDRVVVKDNKAVVLEYKTGEEMDKHVVQVNKYINALIQIGYKDVEGYLVYSKTGDVKKVNI